MSDDLERQLAAFGQTLGAQTPEPIESPTAAGGGIEPTPLHAGRDRRWWAIAGAAAIVMAAIAGFVVVNSTADDDSDIAPVDTGSSLPAPVDTTVPAETTSPATTEPDDTSAPSSSTTSAPTTTGAPTGVAGPWTRECVDQEGVPGSAPADDEFADEPFGPLASEPGVRVVYPETTPLDGGATAPPESRTDRIPGGMLIRLTSTADEQSQVIAVVDDDGSIRWRRCLPNSYGWGSVVDPSVGVAHLEMYSTATNRAEWWTFDLATGRHSVAEGSPAGLLEGGDTPPEVNFTGGEPPNSYLRRTTADGNVLWERTDLFDAVDEGFHVAAPSSTADDTPVLVRACVGRGHDPVTGENCPYALLGIDQDDGSTVWQLEGSFGVPLIADGYAIVTDPDSDAAQYVLIDLDTGDVVPDGVSDVLGAFPSACCGGDVYDRTERDGSVAWSASTDWLDVWFPADRPGVGATVDIMGSVDAPTATARRWWITTTANCSSEGGCSPVRVIGRGFPPSEPVTIRCWQSDGGDSTETDSAQVAVGSDGTVATDEPCVVPNTSDGTVGTTQVRVTIDDVESNVIG